jgi:hypothetical protein
MSKILINEPEECETCAFIVDFSDEEVKCNFPNSYSFCIGINIDCISVVTGVYYWNKGYSQFSQIFINNEEEIDLMIKGLQEAKIRMKKLKEEND